jgi:hypothetical protein
MSYRSASTSSKNAPLRVGILSFRGSKWDGLRLSQGKVRSEKAQGDICGCAFRRKTFRRLGNEVRLETHSKSECLASSGLMMKISPFFLAFHYGNLAELLLRGERGEDRAGWGLLRGLQFWMHLRVELQTLSFNRMTS